MSLFRKKSLSALLSQADDGEKGLKRTLGPANLIALGIGAIIGAGLFVRTAAAAGQAAGPAVTLSFIVAAIGCAFAGLCYAEFASMIPVAGSAYAYSYVTMGELVAWIIGWALIMEYALGAATVSIAWSEYLNKLLGGAIPYEWSHSPFESYTDSTGILHQGMINAPALVILLLLTLLLIKGTQESAFVNAIIVFIKVAIVMIFIAIGWKFILPENHIPYMIPADTPPVTDQAGKVIADYSGWNKHGWGGVLGGAAIVFFAFIGFDAVSTAAQEAKNPKRDMPIGILGSLVVCTILYILFGHVLILVMLMGQSRIFYTMSNDGLIPKSFGDLHPKFKTPYKSNWILFFFVGAFAAFVPGHVAGDLTSFGTLFAFVLVSLGVWILRVKEPNIERPFKTPMAPVVGVLGALICTAMIIGLDKQTLTVAFGWMILGLFVYFIYSKKHSKLQ
ncbi:MAG: amino acid permease [Chitinophagaceae bacterium]|nr:amino acid permease [Chitinophagaceae bacterium]